MLTTFFPFYGSCAHIAWSPNGRFLAIRDALKSTFFIYDVRRKMRLPWTTQEKLKAEGGYCLAWSSHSTTLAIGGSHHVSIVDLAGSLLRQIALPRYGRVISLAWSPSGKELAVTTSTGVCYLYHIASERSKEPHLLQSSSLPGAEVSVHGWLGTKAPIPLLSRSHSMLTLDASEPRLLAPDEPFEIGACACALSPCRRRVALASANQPQVHLFRLRRGEPGLSKTNVYQPEPSLLADYETPWSDGNSFVAWSRDGNYLASCFYPQLTRIYIWDGRSGKTLCVLSTSNEDEQVASLAWGPDHHLAWGGMGSFQICQLLL